MTDIVPISTDVFNIPKQLLNHLDIVAGLDCGVCLTKIVYVPKKLVNYDDESNTIILATALFDSKDVLDAIEFLKNEACLPETGVLHVTGTIGTSIKNAIFVKLGLELDYFDEFESHMRGTKFLVDTLSLEDLTFAPVKEKSYGIFESRMLNKMKKLQEEKDKSTAETSDKPSFHWPAIYVNIGATTTVGLIKEDGTFGCLSSRLIAGGKTLRGLSQILLGTSDYNKIMSLAESGDRCKVDTQIKDVIADDPNSPYGKFPPEMPAFMFGKAAETGSSDVNYAKEDMAASLISMITGYIYGALNGINPFISNNSKIYFSGSVVFSKLFRMEMEFCTRTKRELLKYENAYLKTSHTAAIGAMLTSKKIV